MAIVFDSVNDELGRFAIRACSGLVLSSEVPQSPDDGTWTIVS